MKYSWLLLDADGTLFDYDKAEALALKATFEAVGCQFEVGCVELYRAINGRLWQAFEQGSVTPDEIKIRRFEKLLEALDIRCDPELFSLTYLSQLAANADLLDGAEETLRILSRVVGLVLITNGLQAVQRSRLERSGIGDLFSDVVISEEVGFSKPHRGIFDIAFRRMNQPDRASVLMVGDSLTSDIQGGSDYGIDTCWYNPQRRPRHIDVCVQYEIEQISELLPIVGIHENPGSHRDLLGRGAEPGP